DTRASGPGTRENRTRACATAPARRPWSAVHPTLVRRRSPARYTAAGSARRELHRLDDAPAEVRREMLAKVADIVFGTVHEARLAPAHEVEPEHVEARRIDYPAVVTQASLTIEHWHLRTVQIP